jgi:hypothetical protein
MLITEGEHPHHMAVMAGKVQKDDENIKSQNKFS